ncbi:MAG: DoxX-like family protein [Cyclobacteriaceae bacterium]|nr:DoxX-like family protein [Cyclobacteriaceae bacterium]
MIRTVLKILISLVWLVNGLFCKVLNFVPRHELIVGRILGTEYAPILTKTIGVLEILMFIWILSGIKSRLCSIAQILIVLTMNLIEFFVAPDLLLFGKANLLVALAFTGVLVVYEFILTQPGQKPQ